jgi:hypothetical protein
MLPGFAGHLVSESFLEGELRTTNPFGDGSLERSRRGLASWRTGCGDLGPASTPRTLLQAGASPLLALLGFDAPTRVDFVGRAVAATIHKRGGDPLLSPVALLVTPWGERLDPLWRIAVTQGMHRAAVWCLLFNGVRLRIVDASRLYARRYVEFDLDLAIDDAQSCAALWRTAHASALVGGGIGEASSLHAIVAASDRHAAGVCRSLRDGVLSASGDVLGALFVPARGSRTRTLPDSFEQALTIVYRILFLLFAEARALVPLWHPVYRESYSIEALRDIAEQPLGAPGLWDALGAIARLAHAGCRAGDLRVTPFNGRLFSPARTPLAERRDLDDEAARRAILALSTRAAADRGGRQRIAYRDLGVEQLGAVYETLLDYEPRVARAPAVRGSRTRATVTLESGSGVRKTTGTFYTPQPIAEYLVRRTLAPLVHGASSDRLLRLRIVDPSMGSGAFLVAACRYLAGAYEAALVDEGRCHPGDIGEVERAAMRRAIAERCLYGVDLNPMAVQLARLSLWLATLASDRPLSFLDHRLQVGDSLLGAWLANVRMAPTPRRPAHRKAASLPLFADEAVGDALRAALPIRFSLESTPNDTLAQVREKERAFAAMTARDAALSRWKRVADLWCATWFSTDDLPGPAFAALTDAILSGQTVLPLRTTGRYLEAADEIAAARHFFHWELEFPEVFFAEGGRRLPRAGFDAVIGNPPWDMMRADAGSTDARALARPAIASMLRFTRRAGIYTAQSDGHANRYQLFLERAIDLTRQGGRIGLVLPSGLATDHGSAALRRRLLTRCNVDAIVGIDNHRGLFPIHRSVRFLLVTASPGAPTDRIACRLGLSDAAELAAAGDQAAEASGWFPIRLSPAALERISGPDLAIPVLKTATDLMLLERATSLFPPLGSAAGWSAAFGRELNATDDRDAFRPAGSCSARTVHHARRLRQGDLPVVEGKHIEPFSVALEAVPNTVSAAEARRRLRSDRHDRPRLGYRDVASATNRLTLIAAVLPGGCVSTHTVFCLRTPLPLRALYFLCGLFNSFVVNYLVRLRVTTHVTTATVERLPIPTREVAPAAFREIAALARVLSKRSDPAAHAQLNARVAELYQLSAADFQHVLSTFPLVPGEERQRAFSVFSERH